MKPLLPSYLEDLVLITIPIVWLYGVIGLILLWSNSDQIAVADYIQVFILVTLTATVIVALYTQRENNRHLASKEYLERSVELAEKAFIILCKEDGKPTDNRVAWVSAARLLQRSLSLSALISLDAHQSIYEAERDFQRHKFIKLLSLDQSGHIFTFYTGKNIHDYLNYMKSEIPSGCGHEMIPTKILSTVCRFASFPDGYEDPLEITENLTQEELEKFFISGNKGLGKYFLFRKYFTVIDDQLKTNLSDGGEYRDVDASEANMLLNAKMNEDFDIKILN